MKKHFGSCGVAICVGLASLIQMWPEAMLHVWLLMPDDLKATLPPVAVKWFTYVLMVLSFLGKMYGMRKERNKLREEVSESVPK